MAREVLSVLFVCMGNHCRSPATLAVARKVAAERRARLIAAISDLANTPLQAIELAVALLRDRRVDPGPVLSRLESSVAKLRELSLTLGKWRAESGDSEGELPLAFDAHQELHEAIEGKTKEPL